MEQKNIDEIGGASSEIGRESAAIQRLKLEKNEDRISALSDSLIHHILSFLPSTKQSIQTGILSKRWQNQWTRVPVLIFDSTGKYPYNFNSEDFARSIDSALLQYDCSKMRKLQLGYEFRKDSNFSLKLRFAMTRHVEELILNCYNCYVSRVGGGYLLPKFLFDNSSLVKLKMLNCHFLDDWTINLGSLKAFEMDGCPSKSLVANVVSNCLFLRSLDLTRIYLDKLVIASTSLKKLVLRQVYRGCAIEISCPNLEELDIHGFNYITFKLINSPSLICAHLDFELSQRQCLEDISKQIFEPLQNVEKLTIQGWFIEMLSKVEMGGLSYSWSNNKTLTLKGPNFEHLPGILCALRSSPVLERLVITLEVYEDGLASYSFGENYWNSKEIVASCLESHLKTVEIIGLSQQDAQRETVLNFIKFLIKNARVLEKLVLKISKEYGGTTDFAFEVSQKVSRVPRHSRHAIVELLCS